MSLHTELNPFSFSIKSKVSVLAQNLKHLQKGIINNKETLLKTHSCLLILNAFGQFVSTERESTVKIRFDIYLAEPIPDFCAPFELAELKQVIKDSKGEIIDIKRLSKVQLSACYALQYFLHLYKKQHREPGRWYESFCKVEKFDELYLSKMRQAIEARQL